MFPKYTIDLEGWSEQVYMSLDQYDEMLYDIFDEYGDSLQTNPILMYVMALGSNAVMYSMTRKLMSNPLASQVVNNLASAFAQQQQRHQRDTVPPPPPPPDTRPAVPVDLTGLSDALAGVDMSAIFNGVGEMLSKAAVPREPLQDITPPATEMTPPASDVQQGVMDLLRRQKELIEKESQVGGLRTVEEGSEEEEHEEDEEDEVEKQGGIRSVSSGGSTRLSLT